MAFSFYMAIPWCLTAVFGVVSIVLYIHRHNSEKVRKEEDREEKEWDRLTTDVSSLKGRVATVEGEVKQYRGEVQQVSAAQQETDRQLQSIGRTVSRLDERSKHTNSNIASLKRSVDRFLNKISNPAEAK